MQRDYTSGKLLAVSAVILPFVNSCGLLSRRVKLGEEFTLRPGEKVVIAGTGLGD